MPFKLFKQDVDEETPSPVDTSKLEQLHLGNRRSSSTSTASTVHDAHALQDPHKDKDKAKRFSRLKASLGRRVSSGSSRHSRSSSMRDSTLVALEPIDQASPDVAAQWEKRATMLARAGPPSPALLVRQETIQESAPQLPHFRFDQVPGLEAQPHSHALLQPGTLETVVQPRQVSAGSTQPPMTRAVANGQEAAVALAMERDEGMSKDDLLQEAIREHEADRLAFATQLFRRAARGEDALPMAQLMYGLSLRHGWGIQQDEVEALAWLRLAASSAASSAEAGQASSIGGGLILAIYELGNCFRYGWGVEKDAVLARHYFETAANLGDPDAMIETAWCYENAFGGMGKRNKKRDKHKAAYWYRRAEEKGHSLPGNAWVNKPKYAGNPFLAVEEEKRKSFFKR
jgi:TPR repeat protein